MVIRPWLQM